MLVHFTFFTLFRYPFLSWTLTSSFSNTFGYIEKVFRVNIGFKRQVLFIVLFIIYHNDISPLNALSQYAVSDPCCIHIHYKDISLFHVYSQYVDSDCLLQLQRIHIYLKDISLLYVCLLSICCFRWLA